MQDSPHDKSISTPPAAQAATERTEALALGISFNGRQFRYREFKYDKLKDATAYARLDRSRDGYQPMSPVDTEWLARPVPSDADKVLMEDFGITVDGNSFRYRNHRYDLLADALNFAQRSNLKP